MPANARAEQGRAEPRLPPTYYPRRELPPALLVCPSTGVLFAGFGYGKRFWGFVSFQFSSHSPSLPSLSLSLPLLPLLLLFILFCFCCCFVIVNHRNVSWVRVCVCFGASRVLGFVVSTQNLHSVVPLPLPSSSFHLSSAGPPLSPSDIFAPFCALLFRLFLWSIDLARASRATWFLPPSAGGSKHSAYCKAFANLFSLPRLPTSIPPPLSCSWLRTCR